MPRPPLFKQQQQQQNPKLETNLAPNRTEQKNQVQNQMKLDRLLRQPRSKQYMDAIHQLDAGGHVHNAQKMQGLIDTIRQEFPDIELSDVMLGIVSTCYLGPPYEVHTVDMTGMIIEHYPGGRILPNGLEKARNMALRGGYNFIEVYFDCCRAVNADGTVAVVKG